jgi:DNA-binding LytR/AlgR family response regulator
MAENLKCIIIDDDPDIREYVAEMIKDTPFLEFFGAYSNPPQAIEILGSGTIEVIFLDINLPGIDGMTFAKTLYAEYGKHMPRIIFISGSGDYALEGYKVDAVDYLLKPFTYDEFFKAVLKANNIIRTVNNSTQEFIYLKVEHQLVRVFFTDILYLESMKDYVKVFKTDGSIIIALSTMKAIEEKVPREKFMRVHRSFIVALDKIDSIQHNTVKIGKAIIPVTDQYKTQFKAHTDRLV